MAEGASNGLAELIDGKKVAKRVNQRVSRAVERLSMLRIIPTLAVIRVGDDPNSAIYVGAKQKAAEKLGIRSLSQHLPADITGAELDFVIDDLNRDEGLDAILLQLPLPRHLIPRVHLARIDPKKDADGFHPLNLGQLIVWDSPLRPCTPAGVMELLRDRGVELRGKHAVVISRSVVLGRPMAQLLLKFDATVTICHRHTPDLEPWIRQADLVVAAAGVARLVKGAWIKPGAICIDVGITRLDDGTLSGDIEFEEARARASAITPVPGGVGPMTIAMLMRNTVIAARLRRGLDPDPEL
jgi:methylenetetrahydrofolate dehydrogenase (NADP+) / methenyltetrahydrofolate cyclohydrolase